MNARMTARERMMWKQEVQVFRQNSVTVTVSADPPEALRVLAKTRERAALQRRSV